MEEYDPKKHGVPTRSRYGTTKARWQELFERASQSANGIVTDVPDPDHVQTYAKRLGFKVEAMRLTTGRWLVRARKA